MMNKSSLKRRRSEVLTRAAYPPLMQTEIDNLESQVEEIQQTLGKTDKRYIGSVIGAGVMGFLGFILVSSMTIVGGLAGGVVGLGIGHLVGRKWKKRKHPVVSLARDKQYLLRLASLVEYLKRLRKSSSEMPLYVYISVLEKVVSEFRPAMVLQLHNPDLRKQVNNLCSFLKTNSAHMAMLSSLVELEYFVEAGIDYNIQGKRLRHFFIPVMCLLKKSQNDSSKELEIVARVKEVLSNEKTKSLLDSTNLKDEEVISMLAPYTSLDRHEVEANFLKAKQVASIEYFFNSKNEKTLVGVDESSVRSFSEKLHRRRSSLPGDCSENYLFKMKYQDKLSFEMINDLSRAVSYFNGAFFEEETDSPELSVPDELEESRYSPRSPAKLLNSEENRLHVQMPKELREVINGQIKDFLSAEESQEEERLESHEIIFEEVKEEEPEFKHLEHPPNNPFMGNFQKLLDIENEPNSEKVWKLVVDKPGTTVYQKKSGDSPVCMIKAFCKVDFTPDIIFTAIWDQSVRPKWDTLFDDFRLVEDNGNDGVLYYSIKTPWGITKRDWLQRRVCMRDWPEPGSIILHFESCEHPAMPPKKKCIRAETIISGYIIRPDGQGGSTVTIVSQNDIRGLIPKTIVNKYAAKAPADWVANMTRGCKMVLG